MSLRAWRWGAYAGCAFSLVLVALGLLLGAANRSVQNEIEPYMVNLVVAALAFSTERFAAVKRRPKATSIIDNAHAKRATNREARMVTLSAPPPAAFHPPNATTGSRGRAARSP